MKLYKIVVLNVVLSLCVPAFAQGAEVTAKVLGIGNQNTILVERLDKPRF